MKRSYKVPSTENPEIFFTMPKVSNKSRSILFTRILHNVDIDIFYGKPGEMDLQRIISVLV